MNISYSDSDYNNELEWYPLQFDVRLVEQEFIRCIFDEFLGQDKLFNKQNGLFFDIAKIAGYIPSYVFVGIDMLLDGMVQINCSDDDDNVILRLKFEF